MSKSCSRPGSTPRPITTVGRCRLRRSTSPLAIFLTLRRSRSLGEKIEAKAAVSRLLPVGIQMKLGFPISQDAFSGWCILRIVRSRACCANRCVGLFLPTQSGAGRHRQRLDRRHGSSTTTRPWRFRGGTGVRFGVRAGGMGSCWRLWRQVTFSGNAIDPFITVTALAGTTRRATFAVDHSRPLWSVHPVHLARFAATADHISKGRFGISVVTGFLRQNPACSAWIVWNTIFATRCGRIRFDCQTALDRNKKSHIQRRILAPGGRIRPSKPRYGRPILVSVSRLAGGDSPMRRGTPISRLLQVRRAANVVRAIEALPAHTAKLKAEARGCGREIRTIINPMIVCRSTEAEAREYYDEFLRLADMEAAAGYANHSKSGDSKAWTNHVPRERILGGTFTSSVTRSRSQTG